MKCGHVRMISALRIALLCGVATAAFLATPVSAAFNPAEGENNPTKTTASSAKASTPKSTLRRIDFPPAGTPRQIPVENPGYVEPVALAPVPAPAPAPAAVVAAPAPLPAPLPEPKGGEIAQTSLMPAPLPEPTGDVPVANLDGPAAGALPKIVFPPLGAPAAVPVPAPLKSPEPLSDESKKILSKVPSKLDAPAKTKGGKMKVDRMSPELKSLVDKSPQIETYDATGVSIKVQRPGLDANFELNRAYTALMGGDTTVAIETYKNIISAEPENQEALFGLAATYHRMGELERARPYYGQLLRINPQHREGLNNFIALVADESPQEALAELERLEQRNPEFSPIPAQQAVLLDKMGFFEQAREKMVRAIDLAPTNLTYKYNLAVMLDRRGAYADAGALYRMLIDASMKGEKIPATVESLQKRLNFIALATRQPRAVGG